ncbi:GNAT family N-acetyltransferase [Ideonella azotifigens]|uniref:GNAT family N-acetyltransferase n=1 Tax=Ideonella azotifigens TaxID=513160 RepID=A0ABP3VEM1_9BURK|nr:GNAT family N-acetyltransferase [Ideonella azotifigens]
MREFFLSLRTFPSPAVADGVLMRPLHVDDLDAAHALSVEVQWPHRSMDWHIASTLGQGFVAERDGQVIGTGMRWKWGERHATLGMIIVTQRYQGQRIGTRIMQTLLEGLEDRDVSLHATTEGLGLYERSGFVSTGDVRQHQGIASPAPLMSFLPGERLRPAGRNDPPRLAALDLQAMGMPRERALRMLLDQGEIVVLDRDMEAVGFAVMRRFGRGLVIGPVIAPDLHGAKALIAHFTRLAAGKFLRVDVRANGELIEWVEGLGLRRVAMAIPMTKGAVAASGAIRSFALLSQSLG